MRVCSSDYNLDDYDHRWAKHDNDDNFGSRPLLLP
jgi:hypothetical protein